MNDEQSRTANLARLKALANDPTPENIRNLIALIENLWTGQGFQREDGSDGTILLLSNISARMNGKESNKAIMAAIYNSEFWKRFWIIEKYKYPPGIFELKIPKEAMK